MQKYGRCYSFSASVVQKSQRMPLRSGCWRRAELATAMSILRVNGSELRSSDQKNSKGQNLTTGSPFSPP